MVGVKCGRWGDCGGGGGGVELGVDGDYWWLGFG